MSEVTDNIIDFPGSTLLDIPVEKVLEGAIDASLDQVVVVGVKEDGSTYLAFSTSDLYQILWFLENAKMDVLNMARDD
jgi:hypothetical protein